MNTEFGDQSTQAEKTQIQEDLLCTTCGYNLRMQSLYGRCPECATPIATSLEETWARRLKIQQYQELWWGALGGYLLLWTSFMLCQLILLYRAQLWGPIEWLTELATFLVIVVSAVAALSHVGVVIALAWRGAWKHALWLALLWPLNPVVAVVVFAVS